MLCPWRTADLGLLLILTVFLGAASSSSNMDGKEMTQNYSTPLPEVNTSLSVVIDTNAVLHCPQTWTRVVLTRWEIILRDKPSCTKAHRSDTNETKEINCTDDRITWASRPSQNPDLQIAPVAITHDGYYRCVMVTPDGNFNHNYHLQVLGKERHMLWNFTTPDL
uniref:Immunoglobulin V-set domain-containing protein n=1 Tax=Prolemur simus TaxID=1328070 RepID=A0A8C8ZP30_PROSS